eukprot:Lithocolla_globosa_v1_NODE_47_length_7891_cov_8.351582.p1 type:complete len:1281 gc:universal NODE_47_length_7891_cov_8.351582:3535-7377(+)
MLYLHSLLVAFGGSHRLLGHHHIEWVGMNNTDFLVEDFAINYFDGDSEPDILYAHKSSLLNIGWCQHRGRVCSDEMEIPAKTFTFTDMDDDGVQDILYGSPSGIAWHSVKTNGFVLTPHFLLTDPAILIPWQLSANSRLFAIPAESALWIQVVGISLPNALTYQKEYIFRRTNRESEDWQLAPLWGLPEYYISYTNVDVEVVDLDGEGITEVVFHECFNQESRLCISAWHSVNLASGTVGPAHRFGDVTLSDQQGFAPRLIAPLLGQIFQDTLLGGDILAFTESIVLGYFRESQVFLESSLSGIVDIAASDIDGDTDLDVILVSSLKQLHILRNNGFKSSILKHPDQGSFVVVSDIQNRGFKDVVSLIGSDLWYLESRVDGNYQAERLHSGNIFGVCVGDLNADGMNDIVVLEDVGLSVLFRTKSNFVFVDSNLTYPFSSSCMVLDSISPPRIMIYEPKGDVWEVSGLFVTSLVMALLPFPEEIVFDRLTSVDIELGDNLEILMFSPGLPMQLLVYDNNASTWICLRPFPDSFISSVPPTFISGNLSSGFILVVSDELTYWTTDHHGIWQHQWTLKEPTTIRQVAVADLDIDGELDVVILGDDLSYYTNLGTGIRQVISSAPDLFILVEDITDDGFADVVTPRSIFRNQVCAAEFSKGVFWKAEPFPSLGLGERYIVQLACDVGYVFSTGTPTRECVNGVWGEVTNPCLDLKMCLALPCDAHANCTELIGGPANSLGRNCQCEEGYSGNGEENNCFNIDACLYWDCDENADCTDVIGGPNSTDGRNCECLSGYDDVGSGEPGDCVDVPACLYHECDMLANCTEGIGAANSTAGRTCTCFPGYVGGAEPGLCFPCQPGLFGGGKSKVCVECPIGTSSEEASPDESYCLTVNSLFCDAGVDNLGVEWPETPSGQYALGQCVWPEIVSGIVVPQRFCGGDRYNALWQQANYSEIPPCKAAEQLSPISRSPDEGVLVEYRQSNIQLTFNALILGYKEVFEEIRITLVTEEGFVPVYSIPFNGEHTSRQDNKLIIPLNSPVFVKPNGQYNIQFTTNGLSLLLEGSKRADISPWIVNVGEEIPPDYHLNPSDARQILLDVAGDVSDNTLKRDIVHALQVTDSRIFVETVSSRKRVSSKMLQLGVASFPTADRSPLVLEDDMHLLIQDPLSAWNFEGRATNGIPPPAQSTPLSLFAEVENVVLFSLLLFLSVISLTLYLLAKKKTPESRAMLIFSAALSIFDIVTDILFCVSVIEKKSLFFTVLFLLFYQSRSILSLYFVWLGVMES